MPPPSTLQEPPPSRNFSYPARQRAAALSPRHNQANPPMAPTDSRHFLPHLPSALFTRSTSNLRPDPLPNQTPRRPGTASYTSYSVPDLTLTALPLHDPPPVPPLLLLSQPNLPGINTDSHSFRRLVKSSPPRSPAKSAKGLGWRRVARKLKRAFKLGRQKNRGGRDADVDVDDDAQRKEKGMDIGSPYGFQHVETHGVGPLRTGGPGAGTESARSRGVVGMGGAGVVAGLGLLDVEGTAVEDDASSVWEDYEGDTRIFFSHDSGRLRG